MNKLTLSLLACACTLLATSPALAGDAAAGKTKAEACIDCHGDDGKGDEDNPSIVGMSVADFTQAMVEYQDGTRTDDKMMVKAAKKLNAADIADLAAYYATLKP